MPNVPLLAVGVVSWQKGRRMETSEIQGFQPDRLWPGQQQAVETIIQRVSAGETHTSIVLPTRYGKTHVMRVAGNILMWAGAVSRCFILEPNTYLVGQTADREKMADAIVRFGLPQRSVTVFPMTGEFSMRDLLVERPDFTVMTIQMATRNTTVNHVLQQVVSFDRSTGAGRPLVFIDEAHTGSSENRWGACAQALSDAGALLVLLTATPYRADNVPLYGFDYHEEETEPIRVHRTNAMDPELVDVWGGFKTSYVLDADFEYTFRQAWAEVPPPICHITRRPFDVDMKMVDSDSGEYRGDAYLSELSQGEARRRIGRIIRSDVTIQQGVATFVEELMEFRAKVAEDSKGIVFVGNDREYEPTVNDHAERVREAIMQLATDIDVEIATTSIGQGSEEAQSRVVAFAQGDGADVLIVKQMGGVGMDVPSLKVCLDLSPVRTGPAFVQRMMRIATVWALDTDTSVYTGVYVCPDDIVGKGLFQRFVAGEGGEAAMTNLEYIETYRRHGGDPPAGIDYEPTRGLDGATLYDTEGQQAPTHEALPFVRYMTEVNPRLKTFLTDVDIALLRDIVRRYDEGEGRPPPETPDPAAPEPEPHAVQDIRAEKRRLRTAINKTMHAIISQMNPQITREHRVVLFREYSTILKKDRCGLDYRELKDYSVEEMTHLLEEAERWLNGL